MTVARLIATQACALALVACGQSPTGGGPPPTGDTLQLVPVATGLSAPVYVSAPPGDVNRLFVVEQPGRIRVIQNGQLLATSFLDIASKVSFGGEQGLFSVAFHPSYGTNGFFYVDYTDLNGDTRVERYTVTADSNVADSASHKLILFVKQPYANHNGGLVVFGPHGKLYIGMGDGGSGGDPENRAQNRDSLLGKLLRIDVDAGDPYGVPPDNPFAAGGGRGEIWAVGLRNPWRFGFDPPDGLLYIADVGQNLWEEVDVQPAGQAGVNYGWPAMEATHCYKPPSGCSTPGVLPAVEYSHSDGCSIIGGLVYRGTASPALGGQYFYSDYCSGWIRSFTYAGGAITSRTSWTVEVDLGNVLSFGEDAAGELYVLSGNGAVYRLSKP